MMLLSRSGLDTKGVERALALAEEAWEKCSAALIEDWAATPEGQEARRKADEAFRFREAEMWLEDRLEGFWPDRDTSE